MTAREAARRRRVTVCDPATGRISPADVAAYLCATGWLEVAAPTLARVFERKVGRKRVGVDLFEDSPAEELALLICDLATVERRKPSEALRAIEAHAAGEKAANPAAKRRRRRS